MASVAHKSDSSTASPIRLALTNDLGGKLLVALLNNSQFTVDTLANELEISKRLQIGECDFAIMELSQVVKLAASGTNIQAFFPAYWESKSYGLVTRSEKKAPCRSLAYIVGTPSEYYSLFLYSSPPSILSSDFKYIPVYSTDRAVKLVKSGEIDGVLLNADNQLPSGLKFASKFKPQVFHYMLVRRQPFIGKTASPPSDSNQASLDKASRELVKLLFSLQSRIQDPGKYGLLTSNLRRLDPPALALLNHKLKSEQLKYLGPNSDLTSYPELVAEILMDWKQSPEYSFPSQYIQDEVLKKRIYDADFASSCRNMLSDLGVNATPAQPESAPDSNFSNSDKDLPKSTFQPSTAKEEAPSTNKKASPEPLSSPSSSPAAPTNSINNADEPVSDKEIFKEEIEQGLLPNTPSILPEAPKAPPLPQPNP